MGEKATFADAGAAFRMASNWLTRLGRQPEQIGRELLARAGIEVGGNAPHDVHVHNDELYARVLRDGSLGLGEAYMDGWWDCESVDAFLTKVHQSGLRTEAGSSWELLVHVARYRLLNLQTVRRGREIAEHYDGVGLDVFEATLDDAWMQYTSGDWQHATTLHDSQRDKLELLCRKAGLEPGSTLLDIGCGWGGLARYAGEHFGARTVGVTISREQIEYVRARAAGLELELRLQDYREIRGQFDAIVSCEMLAHVGLDNLGTFFAVCRRCLAPGGTFVLQFITNADSQASVDPWLERYIFQNHFLASLAQVMRASEPYFIVEDVHSLGTSYVPTLLAWNDKFEAAWPELRARYDERFRRMWRYYLLMSAAVNRVRDIGVTQVVFTPRGEPARVGDWRLRPQYTG